MRASQNCRRWFATAAAASSSDRWANCRAMSLAMRTSGDSPTWPVPRRWPAPDPASGPARSGTTTRDGLGLGGSGRVRRLTGAGEADLDGGHLVLRAVGRPVGVLGGADVGAADRVVERRVDDPDRHPV